MQRDDTTGRRATLGDAVVWRKTLSGHRKEFGKRLRGTQGPASDVRKVTVTPETERAVLDALKKARR